MLICITVGGDFVHLGELSPRLLTRISQDPHPHPISDSECLSHQ